MDSLGALKQNPARHRQQPDAVSPSPPPAKPPAGDAPQQPDPPESKALPRRRLGLDRLGVLQVLGAIALSLIPLFSSYDHITRSEEHTS